MYVCVCAQAKKNNYGMMNTKGFSGISSVE